jgi:hypothetical protein
MNSNLIYIIVEVLATSTLAIIKVLDIRKSTIATNNDTGSLVA